MIKDSSIGSTLIVLIMLHLSIIIVNWVLLDHVIDDIEHDVTIVNSSGKIRGATQKLLNQYLLYEDFSNDIQIIDNEFAKLKTVELLDFIDTDIDQFDTYITIWTTLKEELTHCKENRSDCIQTIKERGETAWQKADEIVRYFTDDANRKFQKIYFIFSLFFVEIIMVTVIIIYIYRRVNRFLESERIEKYAYIELVDKHIITSSTDLRGKITYVSEAFCEISGYSQEELIGKYHNIVRHPDMPTSLYDDMWKRLKKGESWQGEIKNRTKDGDYYWVQAHISPLYRQGAHIGFTAIRYNITDKKKLEHLSITDPMTGLYNRRKFQEVVDMELNRLQRADRENRIDQQFYFILFDVDHFKEYNDTYGHDEGDTVLKKIAQTLELSLKRSTDFAFRLGGEEFAITSIDDDLKKVHRFVDTLRQEIELLKISHQNNTASKYVTVSVGIAFANERYGYAFEVLYSHADKALYRAKEGGRNRTELYKGGHNDDAKKEHTHIEWRHP